MIKDCNQCKYCSPKEYEQSKDKESHMCKLLNKVLKHHSQDVRYHELIKPDNNCPLNMKYSGCNYWINQGKNEFEPIGTAQSIHDCNCCKFNKKDEYNMCGMKRDTETWDFNEDVRKYLNEEFEKLQEYRQSKSL